MLACSRTRPGAEGIRVQSKSTADCRCGVPGIREATPPASLLRFGLTVHGNSAAQDVPDRRMREVFAGGQWARVAVDR